MLGNPASFSYMYIVRTVFAPKVASERQCPLSIQFTVFTSSGKQLKKSSREVLLANAHFKKSVLPPQKKLDIQKAPENVSREILIRVLFIMFMKMMLC